MTHSPLRRLRIGLVALAVISLLAVMAYCMAGLELLDSIYMVAMILSTVGLGEVAEMTMPLKLITTVLMVVGVTTALYLVGGLVQMMAEGEINRALGLRRVTKEIERLTDHVIVCGFGRMGEILGKELQRQKTPFVVLENDTDAAPYLHDIVLGQLEPGHGNRALLRHVDAVHVQNQRGFACAIRPEQGDPLPGMDVQVYPIERDCPVGIAELETDNRNCGDAHTDHQASAAIAQAVAGASSAAAHCGTEAWFPGRVGMWPS